jgi:F-type H+-transporting ATPase subunit b
MLSIDYSVIVIIVIVWILVLVLTKVYFKPMSRVMRERDDMIQQDQTSAQEALEKYGSVLEKIEENIKAAKTKARDTREKFDREAQKEKGNMIEEVAQECRAQVNIARKEIDEKVESLKKELEPESQDFAKRIAKRLLN